MPLTPGGGVWGRSVRGRVHVAVGPRAAPPGGRRGALRRAGAVVLGVLVLLGGQVPGLDGSGSGRAASAAEAGAVALDAARPVAGARLPIETPLPTRGSFVYVSPRGDDDNPGGQASPVRTLAEAIARAGSRTDATVVLRGGVYREGNVVIPRGTSVDIRAFPGEIPEFRGSVPLAGRWVTSGGVSHHAYRPQPVTDGGGVSFRSGQGLSRGAVGKYPDQVWVGSRMLRQVRSRSSVAPGTFWVDRRARRVHISARDLAQGPVEASARSVFLTIRGARSTLSGVRVTRFSNGGADHGVVQLDGSADGTSLREVEILDSSFQAISMIGGASRAGILARVLLEDVTIARANWMGISATWVDDLTLRRVLIHSLNQHGEFRDAPVSGALKATRVRRVTVVDSQVRDVRGHGLWFDQSSAHVVIAGNDISGVRGSSVFFEISDDLLLINNVIRSRGQRVAKLAGASGLKLVNNTLVGGADPVGIYADSRSKRGCARPGASRCRGSHHADRDAVRPRLATLDWMPRLDLMINNVLAHPSSRGYCGRPTTLCIMLSNSGASVPLRSVIHRADPRRGIPRTRIDGNVYVNPSGPVAWVRPHGALQTSAALGGALAVRPVGIAGMERAGRSGRNLVRPDGTPTPELAAAHGDAVPIPDQPALTAHLPVGLRHYGAVR